MAKENVIRTMRQNVFANTKRLLQETGPRRSGTPAAQFAAKRIGAHFETFANRVDHESFMVRYGAFLGWIRLLVCAYALGIVAFWLAMPWLTVALMVVSLTVLTVQFIFYRPLIDRFFPRRPAENVVATVEPIGLVKEQVILSGHHDSARVFNFLAHQPALYGMRVTGSIVWVIFMLLASLWGWFRPDIGYQALAILLSAGFLWVGQMWFFASKKATPGAGDNLISTFVASELGEHFSVNRLHHTRVIVVSFDAEEEGLRGARAFAKRHCETLTTVPTYMINFECLYDDLALSLLSSDLNGTVKLDKTLIQDIQRVGKQHNIKTVLKPIAFLTGGTDAAELAKIGVSATTLFGMVWSNQNRSSVYHTMADTPANVSKKAVEQALSLGKHYVKQRDQKVSTT